MAGSNARGTGQQHNRELSPGLSQGTDTQGDPPVPGTRPALPWGRFLEETGRLSLGRGRVRTQPGSWFCSQTVPGNACVLSQAGTGDMRCATSPRTHRHRAVMVRALYTLLGDRGCRAVARRATSSRQMASFGPSFSYLLEQMYSASFSAFPQCPPAVRSPI